MLLFVCINAGDYCSQGKKYVEILYDSISRNLKYGTEAKFICFTDDSEPYYERIEKRPLPNPELKGWWHKLSLFKEGLFDEGDRIIYFDLDTVIVGGLDIFIDYRGNFAILRDVYRQGGSQSSVMMWKANQLSIWGHWQMMGYAMPEGGDQLIIEDFFSTTRPDVLQDIYPNCFRSYKVDCRRGIPRDAKIVFFHGEPKPHEAGGWVDAVWKIGGGTALELEMVSAISPEQLERNVRHAISLDVDIIDRQLPVIDNCRALLIGGGPSLKRFIPELKIRQRFGEKIFALNNVYKFLADNGIIADYQVLADPRPENLQFVPHETTATLLYASHCDPSVIDAAVKQKALIWHLGHEGMREIVNPGMLKSDAYFAGGGTVGLVTMSIAYALGYRKIELFGYDSSYEDDHGHAYEQKINDSDQIIEVELYDKKFKTTAWMVDQANDFNPLVCSLVELGCEIKVHGDGLLPHIAHMMAMEAEPEDEIIEIDGMWWPKHDLECRESIIDNFSDLKTILSHCDKFDTVIQAGGNVGAWPKELSKHFKSVYTFEPDNINFQCLSRNVTESNVIKFQAAIGSSPAFIALHTQRSNCGAHFIEGDGIIPTLLIDSLGLMKCDLIQLDIEGFEYHALQGALDTIKRCKPVIVCEEKNLGEKYGVEFDAIGKLLAAYGYKVADKFHRDVVYVTT